MPAHFRAARCTINWHGVDDDTPPGHSIAIGTDSLGNRWLWLFKGDQATDDAFIGSVSIPAQVGQIPSSYGRRGGWAGLARVTKEALSKLADRANTEG